MEEVIESVYPKPIIERINFYLDRELKKRVRKSAKLRNLSMSQLIIALLTELTNEDELYAATKPEGPHYPTPTTDSKSPPD